MWSFALRVGETSPWQSIRGLAALQMLRYGGIHGRRGGGDRRTVGVRRRGNWVERCMTVVLTDEGLKDEGVGSSFLWACGATVTERHGGSALARPRPSDRKSTGQMRYYTYNTERLNALLVCVFSTGRHRSVRFWGISTTERWVDGVNPFIMWDFLCVSL